MLLTCYDLPSMELLKRQRSRMDLHVLRPFRVVPILGVGYPGLTTPLKNLVNLRELNPGHRFAKPNFVLFEEPLQPGPHLQLVGDFEVWDPISECQNTRCCPILSTTNGQRLTE